MSNTYPAVTLAALSSIAGEIFTAQRELNSLYNQNWEVEYDSVRIRIAAVREMAEMLDELKGIHTFFGSKKDSDYAKGLEEFIDVVHFMATRTLLMYQATTNPQVDLLFIPDSEVAILDAMVGLVAAGYFFNDIVRLLAHGCSLFNVTPEHMLVAYLHKNRKNRSRALNGAASRDIDKSQEQSTYDYMYEKGFFADTAEQYNLRMNDYAKANPSVV
ncbi:MAG: dUTP diphosphatase [Aeromonas popoffii]|uniref:dUTP diphosphatase n=1 Tax=Aeromonas popoffii TaxID=70856 RepID=UPI003F2A8365